MSAELDSVGRLSPEELAARAYDELGETPELKVLSVQSLREMIQNSEDDAKGEMQARIGDDRWLLAFLRGTKYDVDKAFDKMKNYFALLRTCQDLKPGEGPVPIPTWTNMKDYLDTLPLDVLPGYDRCGRKCFTLNNVGRMEELFDVPKYKENIKLILLDSMVLFEYLMYDEQTQICGFSAVENLADYGISMIWRLTKNPEMMKVQKLSAQIQNLVPLRWGNMYIFDAPWYFNVVWGVIKPFMSKKITSRLNFMSSKDINKMYDSDYHRSFMPPSFGGTLQYDFGEDFLRRRVEEEGNEYVPGGRFLKGAAGWVKDGNSVCTSEELVKFRQVLSDHGLEVYKKDRHGRMRTRVLYSPDQGNTLCFAEKFGGAKPDKQFPVREITDVRRVQPKKKKKGEDDAFEIVHPARTLQILVGTEQNREILVKRIRGMVLETTMACK